MIERFYLKDHLSFKEVELEFDKNFVVFTGESGAGKSILMEALLSLFGLKECEAKLIEASVNHKIGLEDFGIDEDEPNIFSLTKQKSARYFINNRQISKKNIKSIGSRFVNYLSLREFSEFENENLLSLIDAIAIISNIEHKKTIDEFQKLYFEYKKSKNELEKILLEEKKIEELKEFTAYEIKKIENIAPDIDEYEKLIRQKKELSKKEKIQDAVSEALLVFDLREKVSKALLLLEKDSTFFDECMSELEAIFEEATLKINELEGIEVESLLDRIEQLSSLKRKYGSIEEALLYLQKKKEELSRYENLESQKHTLEQKVLRLKENIDALTSKISIARSEALKTLQKRVEHYLNLLYLKNVKFSITKRELTHLGVDLIQTRLGTTELKKISAGELNRLRLAMLAASSEFVKSCGGVLILDEIDANVSGKESMSIASVLKTLSKNYQIFAISHQPQLSSVADMHFLVYKDETSKVKLLNKEGRINELSRMISGKKISDEALNFAKSLLKDQYR